MSLQERQAHLIAQINQVKDEHTLEIIEENIFYLLHGNSKDVTDDLTEQQFQELKKLAEEPFDKDTITKQEFIKITE